MTNRPTTASLDVFALYVGRHVSAVRIDARAGKYGSLILTTARGKGARKISLATYEKISGYRVNFRRLADCERLHRTNLENARLYKLLDFCDQRLEEIAAAKELKKTQPRRGNPMPKVPPDGPPQ